jgi:hypothetical protein
MSSYLSLPGDYAIISQSISNLQRIISYQVIEDVDYDNVDGTVVDKEVRWSFDQEVYSSWIELTLSNIENISLTDQSVVYFQIRYTLVSGEPLTINTISNLITTRPESTDDNVLQAPFNAYTSGNHRGSAFLNDFYFDPYAVNLGVELQRKLSFNVNKIFGHKAAYIRVTPQMRSLDVILKEYGIYESSKDYKCLKILVPNNQFPDSKLNFNPFNIDYEEPFEVHIDKRYFESFFGKGVGPQKRDIIYLPIANRLYEVASSTQHRDFMYKDLYYKVSLIKYADKANVLKDEAILTELDELSNSTAELFDNKVAQELKKITNVQQFTISTRKSDKVRDYIDPNLLIEERDLLNYHTLISHYRYDLSASPVDSEGAVRTMVDYLVPVSWNENAERALTCWFLLRNPTTLIRSVTVLEEYGTEYTITTNADVGADVGDTVTFSKTNSTLTFYGTVTEKVSATVIKIVISTDIQNYLNNNFPDWSCNCVGLKVRKNYPRVFIDGLYNDKGFRLECHDTRFFKATVGEDIYNFILPTSLSLDTWYCLVFNYSSQYKQLSLTILKRKWNPSTNTPTTTEMDVVYEYVFNNINIVDVSHPYKYKVMASYLKMTNLRLMSTTIEPEKMVKFLNESIVSDSDQSLIIDNAIPRMKLPYVGGHPNKLL